MSETMTASLKAFFADFDKEMLKKQIAWGLDRRIALKDYKSTLSKTFDAWKVYTVMYDICGGKSWYNVFNNATETSVEAFMKRNYEAVSEKRNFKIIAQLKKAGITEIKFASVSRSEGGFNGTFVVNDEKIVKIMTVYAGGYNVQSLHQRTLVYLNDKKI